MEKSKKKKVSGTERRKGETSNEEDMMEQA